MNQRRSLVVISIPILLACGCGPEGGAADGEQRAAERLAAIVGEPAALAAFAKAMPKGGDLHNHLSGSVYAEEYLTWGAEDGNCINDTSLAAVGKGQCATAGNLPIPAGGTPFHEEILGAWSMYNFVPGAQSGHDHFFATFGKFGLIAGGHRDDSIADLLIRAADENQVYLETMFNAGTNVGALSASLWSGTLTAVDLPALYDQILASAMFEAELTQDVTSITNAATRHRAVLDCDGASPPPACAVRVRFIAQIARTGANDTIFGQLVSAFEMASRTPALVGANLSSPEDDESSLRNYELHMAMLGFLHDKYKTTGQSPLRVTLHAGELVPAYLPPQYSTANTFHIRRAVEVAHADRIGHGLDIASETDSDQLLETMREQNVLVEICLSSNDQILDVRGAAHPLALYLERGVPVALATDDQGVSRSSMAGELQRAARDHHLDYRQLKTMARRSLEHAFLPGASLWASFAAATSVDDCALTEVETPSATCQAFLAANERAAAQWELERRFRAFEQQP